MIKFVVKLKMSEKKMKNKKINILQISAEWDVKRRRNTPNAING